MTTTTTTTNDEIDFDISQLDDTLISDTQKQTLLDYINQLKSQKNSLHEEYNQFKSSTGSNKRRRTKRQLTSSESNVHLQTMLETLIYIVHEINLEQVKLTTTINQLTQRINQNELYLTQLNINIENLYDQYHNKPNTDINLALTDENSSQPIDMSRTGTNFHSTKTERKSNLNKEYVELGDPSAGLSCAVLKRKYDQVRRRTELAYIHGEKRAIGRLLTFLIRQFFTNDELRNASLDGRVRNTQALAKDRMKIIDEHLQAIFGIDYNLYRLTKDCAEQVNVVCRHARNPKNFYENAPRISDDAHFDEYETFQEELFIQANEQRFHELSQEYESVRNEVVQQREVEQQLKQENEQLKNAASEIEKQLANLRENEQQLQAKLEATFEQVRQITLERDQLKNLVLEKERETYEFQKQCESLEEENRQVHQTNTSTIARLQELENTRSQLQSLESLWNKERQLYTDQIQTYEQSLIESKKQIVEQQTKNMQLTVQLESSDGQLQGEKRSLDSSLEEKNQSILNLDRQVREKAQRIEQLQTELQRISRQNENEQLTSSKTIQSLKTQIDDLTKKTTSLTEQSDEQKQLLTKLTSERDVLKTEIRTLTETHEKQAIENEQTIRRLQDELDNTTQLLESIRSKGADLTQLTNFLDGTLSHIRSNEPSTTPSSTTNCSECRQLKSALVLELTGKERFRFGYDQLSSMIKEAAPILRRQKQDYEASFEVIAKLTSELNEARKELSELHQLSGESIENYRYIQREKQFLINDNKSLATKIQVLLSEIEELRTGKRPADYEPSTDSDPNQQVPLTFRNVVELQHVNQKLDKLVREMRAQNENSDEDLNGNRFDVLKKEHQQQQEKFKETKTQLDSLETQMTSLIQERDFLRLLVSRSSSSQNTSSTNPSVDNHQVENLRDQVNRLQEKIEALTKKNNQLTNEKDEHIRSANEKYRSVQYELLTTRTEAEQVNEKLNLMNDELATSKLTVASLRTEIHSWQERHSTLVQIRNKQEQQYFNVLTEFRQLKDEKTLLDCRLNTLENEKKFDSIKYEQIESECQLLKSEISKNEQIQPVIDQLQTLAELTKEKTKAMFEAKINDLINENQVLNQRIEQNEREKELLDRQYQTRLDELTQALNQEKNLHQEHRTKYLQAKEKAEQLEKKLNDIETKLTSNTTQKTDFEQQLGDYEKELKILRVKLDAANNELELKQTVIQSNTENTNQLNLNKQQAIEELEKSKGEYTQKLTDYESEITRLKQDLLNSQTFGSENEENLRSANERIQTLTEQHQAELVQLNQQIEESSNEKSQFSQQIEQTLTENEQLKERLTQLESTFEQQQLTFEESESRVTTLLEQIASLESSNQRLLDDLQQFEVTLLQKDEAIKTHEDLLQQTEQRYAELEQKHTEQHQLMVKLSTHLAAKESEVPTTTTTETNVNETWNTILSMNNYLRVENTRLTDDLERIRLENAHLNERHQTTEQVNQSNQQIIDELKFKNQSLENLQGQYDRDQEQIQSLQGKCSLLEQEKASVEQKNQTYEVNLNQLTTEQDLLKQKLHQAESKDKLQEDQLMIKGTELEELKAKITKLESDNQELKQMTTRLKQIAIKYRATANAVVPSAQNPTPTSTTAPAASTETEDLLSGGAGEPPATRALPVDVSEKMNKLRDALLAARAKMSTQQTRLTQMTSELARVKQSRIATDLTEVHALVDSIRQTYESEINELKQIIQLFDSTDPNEQMTEILRLKKKIEDMQATSVSEDVTPKPPARPQAFAPHTTQEPVISRVVPMAPATGRQIGVATPMTASTTATTTSAPLWTAGTPAEAPPAQTISPVEHPTTQMSTAAGVNLLMKRTRTDDGDQRSMESTVKRTRPETETAPLIAHVEPQVREQQTPVQEPAETPEIDIQRTDVVLNPMELEMTPSPVEEAPSANPESDAPSTSTVVSLTETTTTISDSTNLTSTEQPAETHRVDIVPIVYNVQTIPTIGSGGPVQANRGGPNRPRPSISIPGNRRMWPARGTGGGRGLGGRGAGPGSAGPSARQ